MLSADEVQRWAIGFIQACEQPAARRADDQLSPYLSGVMLGLSDSLPSEDAWRVILAVLSRKPSDEVLGRLAAGPLEELIQTDGAAFIERMEECARKEPAFRHLLGGVWRSGTTDIWARVEKARAGIVW